MPVNRSRLPPPGPEPHFAFPEIRRRRLSNGLDAWTAVHREVPLVSVLVVIRAGAALDPADRPGLAALTGDLLDEGCGGLDALALHETLGRLGAQIETEVGADATLVGLTTLERSATPALTLLAEMLARPSLEGSDFDRVRDLRLNRLLQLRDMPPAIAERVFTERLYGAHPYGHLPIGTAASLRAMALGEVRAFHLKQYRPSRVTVIAVGNALEVGHGGHAALADSIEAAFGNWTCDTSDGIEVDPAEVPVAAASSELVIVPRAGAPQSELRIGHVAVARTTPDYHALVALNLVLGGQFVSRINSNLRERKGYTYGARTSFEFRRGRGPFALQASLQADATADAVREALGELHAIRGERPVTAEELELGRAPLTRGYPRGFETAEQIARAAAQLALYDLPDDYFTTFVPRVLALTPEDLTRAAAAHIDPSRLVGVIVGDRDKIGAVGDVGLGEPMVMEPK
jgi:zinc protease